MSIHFYKNLKYTIDNPIYIRYTGSATRKIKLIITAIYY